MHLPPAPRPPSPGPPFVGCLFVFIAIPVLGIMALSGVFSSVVGSFFGIGPGIIGLLPVLLAALALYAVSRVLFRAASPTVVRPSIPPLPQRPLTTEDRIMELRRSLPDDLRRRSEIFTTRAEQLKSLLRSADDIVTRTDATSGLDRLAWVHLKLLLARAHLDAAAAATDAARLHAQATDLRLQLQHGTMSPQARESRAATLAMLEERITNISRRQCRTDEINSDLDRIEAQVDLAGERHALQSDIAANAFQLDLATRMVDDADFFGTASPEVSAVDEAFGFREREG